jgi:hypothetical protein
MDLYLSRTKVRFQLLEMFIMQILILLSLEQIIHYCLKGREDLKYRPREFSRIPMQCSPLHNLREGSSQNLMKQAS